MVSELFKKPLKTKSSHILEHPDIFQLKPDPSIKIEAIRNLKAKLKLKPYLAQEKIAIISSAEKLTLPAQHALLKTLEEPTKNTYLILEIENPNQLLDTIRSRCQIIRVKSSKSEPPAKALNLITNRLKSQSYLEKIKASETLKKQDNLKTFLIDLLNFLTDKMRNDPGLLPAVKLTNQLILDIDANVNQELAIENYALRFPSLDSKKNC